MYICEMTRAKKHIHKYMILQCSTVFYSKVSSAFLRQDSQSSCSFDKIQNVGDLELSEEKTKCFIGERFHISFSHIYTIGTQSNALNDGNRAQQLNSF